MGFFSSIGGILGGIGGAIIGGPAGAVIGSGLGGGLGSGIDSHQANKTAAGYYNSQMGFARSQAQFQQDYIRNMMQWRVEDAKNAGVHPMAALGVSNPSYSPVSSPASPQIYDAGQFDTGSTFGQSLNRASFQAKNQQQQIQAARLGMDQIALQNQGLGLENQYKQLQIAQLASELQRNSGSSAPAPGVHGGVLDGQPNSYNPDIGPLMQLSRMGNVYFEHVNPDLSDAVTESMVKSGAFMVSAEAQAHRTKQEALNAIIRKGGWQAEALKAGDAILQRIPSVGWQVLLHKKYMPKKNADGSFSGKINKYGRESVF